MTREDHLLIIIAEEAGEIIHVVTKALRFGLDNVGPDYGAGKTNAQLLVAELNDLISVVQMLKSGGGIPDGLDLMMPDLMESKRKRVEQFLEYSQSVGRLTE